MMVLAWVGVTACLPPVAAEPSGPRIALLYSDHGDFRHRDDYDGRLADLGWPLTKFENKDFGELAARLREFDLLLGSALFNYSNVQDFAVGKDPLLTFVREGGAVVLTDCNYPSMVGWLGALGDGWEVSVANTKAAVSPPGWLEAEHPLFTTPNRIASLGGSWAHMQVGPAWAVLARSEEGGATAVFRREGRGFLYLTSRWPLDGPLLQNLWTCLQLSRAGLEASLPDLSALHLGDSAFTARVRNLTEGPLPIAFEVLDRLEPPDRAASATAEAALPPGADGSLTAVVGDVPRGRHQLSATLSVAGTRVLGASPVEVTIPPLLQVSVVRPAYRGAIYAACPPREIELQALVTPDPGESLADLTVSARLASGRPVSVTLDGPRANLVLPLGVPPRRAVRATVTLQRGGGVLAREEVTLPRLPARPHQVLIDESGATRLEGAPFFPIGIYHVPVEDFDRLPALGFNSVVAWGTSLDSAQRGLDAAQAAGLKVVLELSAFLRGEYSPTGLAELIDGAKGHPALLAWYTVDEPAGKQLDWCRDALRLIQERDPDHPVYLVSCNPAEFAQYAPTTEVLAIDPYPIPQASVSAVADWMKIARQAVAGRKPVWLIPQCHNQIAYSNPQAGRGPTPAEERCMVYQGLIYGAKGIIYYPWDDGPCGLIHDPALVEAVGRLNSELAHLGPELLASRHELLAEGADPPGLQAARFIGEQRTYRLTANTQTLESSTIIER